MPKLECLKQSEPLFDDALVKPREFFSLCRVFCFFWLQSNPNNATVSIGGRRMAKDEADRRLNLNVLNKIGSRTFCLIEEELSRILSDREVLSDEFS